jgi:hypothetical protein
MSTQPPLSRGHPEQEPSDLRPRAVLLGAAGIIAMVVLVALTAYGLSRLSGPTDAIRANPEPARSISLRSDPETEIADYRRQKRTQLESYGWVDRPGGFAHIPIERAMQMLASQHPGTAHDAPH